MRKLGDGSNALVYLAKCRVGGRLHAHTDALVVLKVLVHYRQEGVAGDLTRSASALDRRFRKEVEREARVGLYPTVNFQYSSTTLYQVSYHIR